MFVSLHVHTGHQSRNSAGAGTGPGTRGPATAGPPGNAAEGER